jgi:hexosaminidase
MKACKFKLLPIPREISFSDKLCENIKAEVVISPKDIVHIEGYRLNINASGIKIIAHDEAGAFYAKQTLAQLELQSKTGTLPCVEVVDWPAFPNRGIMLDVSRDRVPTMDCLFKMIDMFASWKINHLELYIEHTFAYKNHREVWKDASPFTAKEIQEIDAYCKELFIELVPFQNSFGHMHRWLKHDNYRHLAEYSDGWPMAWSMNKDEPFSLCPTAPESIEFLEELYDEYLPNFSSNNFMVGCDETEDSGQGRSKKYCQKVGGKGKLYLEFLWKLHNSISKHGKTMMYFGDIIINYPELLNKLPKDAILMHWGYYIDFPYEEHCKLFAEANLPFYVLPSNAAYSSVAGRTARAIGNIRNAAFTGLKYGAGGMVNTEWGDNGHWHSLTVSTLGYAYGAAMSWYPEANQDIDIARTLDILVFKDKAGVVGKLLYDLGNCYLHTSKDSNQSSNLYMIAFKAQCKRDEAPFNELTIEDLQTTLDEVNEIMARLDSTNMHCNDAKLVKEEITMAGGFVRFVCNAGLKLLKSNATRLAELPDKQKQSLIADLNKITELHEQTWKQRSRNGGLKDSLWWFQQIIEKISA